MEKGRLLGDSVRLYHKKGENTEGKALYEVFELNNVRFENRDSIYASNRGLKPYDGFKLYFNTVKSEAINREGSKVSYISPITWKNLSAENKMKYWTVTEHDLITQGGNVDDEVIDMDEMKEKHEVYYINSVIPCRNFGEIRLLEITGRGRSVDSD